jgi:hypothetical protein
MFTKTKNNPQIFLKIAQTKNQQIQNEHIPNLQLQKHHEHHQR